MTEPVSLPEGGGQGVTLEPMPADSWEGCSDDDLARYWGVPAVHLYELVGSTNDLARRLAASGSAPGTLVLAEEQRSGRGRGSRTWASPPGVGIWCSMVFRDLPVPALGTLPLRVGSAIAAALDPYSARAVEIKWPNDLLLEGRKVGGILCEAAWEGPALSAVIVGFGLNLLQKEDDFPDRLRPQATSLALHAAGPISRFEVATDVVRGVRRLLDERSLAATRLDPATFRARDALLGRPIDVIEPESGAVVHSGVAAGIDSAGALLVRSGNGVAAITSGTIRLRA
jgi:BirA family transcriptional regulator, biotin operon repressor / biotin---[acetyl-CoA-carboxylase] ligase